MRNMTITKIYYDSQELEVHYQGTYSTEMDVSFIFNAENMDVYDHYESNKELSP